MSEYLLIMPSYHIILRVIIKICFLDDERGGYQATFIFYTCDNTRELRDNGSENQGYGKVDPPITILGPQPRREDAERSKVEKHAPAQRD